MKKFIKILIKIVVICCIPVFLFKGCLYMMQKNFESGAVECGLCKQTTELAAQNGEKLALAEGNLIGRTGNGAWMECSCGMLLSFENNAEYVQEKINKMGDYWQKLSDCSQDDFYAHLRMGKSYAEKLSFPLAKECYFHHEYTSGQDIIVLYGPDDNRMLFLYRTD